MSFILIDRRKTGKGKSAPNRQKLVRRIKGFIKSSQPQNIGKQGGVTGTGGAHTPPAGGSPVKVANSAIEEPYFAYANDGTRVSVIIGNTEYDRGDEIELPPQDDGGEGGDQGGDVEKGSGQGDGGQDEFVINIARDEYLDLFYEDCELPNLVNEKYTEKLDNTTQPAGFSTNGAPAQLSIIRSYKQSISRIAAMSDPLEKEREELVNELRYLQDRFPGTEYLTNKNREDRIAAINKRIAEIDAEILFFDSFDNSDMRYRKKEAKPLKTVDAVIIFLMDISASMDENKKTIARRWFALLYGFIKRRYQNSVELVFIAHTDEPFEMSEDDFFSTRINGSTTVSPALKLINNIIKERYDPEQTNIYISHASDGDNWQEDNNAVIAEMTDEGHLLNKIQFFSYVEVGRSGTPGWFNIGGGKSGERDDTGLWTAYDTCRTQASRNKVILSVIESPEECYPTFQKVFRKSK